MQQTWVRFPTESQNFNQLSHFFTTCFASQIILLAKTNQPIALIWQHFKRTDAEMWIMLRGGINKCALKTWHACWDKPRQSTGVLIREMKRFSARKFPRDKQLYLWLFIFKKKQILKQNLINFIPWRTPYKRLCLLQCEGNKGCWCMLCLD